MKQAKKTRKHKSAAAMALKGIVRKPRYRLADLLAQCAAGPVELTEEMRAWENMPPVGKEIL